MLGAILWGVHKAQQLSYGFTETELQVYFRNLKTVDLEEFVNLQNKSWV